jgi:hypothetical protein
VRSAHVSDDEPPLTDRGFGASESGISESGMSELGVGYGPSESEFLGERPPAAPEPPEQAIETAESHFLEAALADAETWDQIVERYPPDKFQNIAFRSVAGAVHTLRQGGESITRDALAGMLADSDEAIRALQVLQSTENSGARALRDLERILYKQELKQALQSQSLAEVVRAREGGPEQAI